eukprot:gene7145-7360_t
MSMLPALLNTALAALPRVSNHLTAVTTSLINAHGWQPSSTARSNLVHARPITSILSTKGKRIDKLLIANRGEIACRVIKSARRLGIKTVAVYSEADKYCQHVVQADEAVCVGPAAALQSYLNIDAIVDAIKKTGARAVHPGYGFLSENAEFVDRLNEEGIIFVGPPASAIRALGDKVESKRIAKEAGLHIIPGYVGEIIDEAHAIQVAEEIGYPVMIKASAGGGGKGMRIAWNRVQLKEEVPLAKAEAMSAFGNDTLLIEKFVEAARHIEFQVVGDHFGHLVYLPERDCSVQRRNQKVIEESPSPFISPAVRAAMGEQAVKLAAAVGYNSTGTVEFVVDKNSSFYFLEMNTRLQVEHPVTEAVTGLDLVNLMLAIACNQRLDISQERAAAVKGHALECRIYAEDPARNFAPSPGLLKVYREPEGPDIRVDSGVVEGSDISVHYDPMVAKLITSGPNRQAALDRMEGALDRFVVKGVVTNMPHLRSVLANSAFQAGEYNTSFIPAYYGGPSEPRWNLYWGAVVGCGQQGEGAGGQGMRLWANGLNPLAFPLTQRQQQDMFAAAVFTHVNRARRFDPNFLKPNSKAELTLTWKDVHEDKLMPLPVVVRLASLQMVGPEGVAAGALEIQLPERVAYVYSLKQDPLLGQQQRSEYNTYLRYLMVDGQPVTVQVAKFIPRGVILQYLGAQRELYIESPAAAALAQYMPARKAGGASRVVRSPMTGTLVQVLVDHGSEVRVGDDLMVIEAMKMRNAIKADREGYVDEVFVKQGQIVAADQPLLKFWEHFTNLQDFLDAYNVAMTVLVTEDDFYQLTTAYLKKAAANNITHVEIFFDAQHHLSRGLPLVTMVRGMQAAIAERRTDPQQPVDAHLILCLVRELGEVAAAQTLVRALPYVMDLTALGLASAEVGNPPGEFKDVYRAASLLGLHKVAHAGEEGGPEYVWEALKVLGVERVDHGIRTLEDTTLVQYMADNKVPITLCPLSNLRLQVYAGSLEEKIKEILATGIVVTLNSDDPAYFGGYLNANYEWVTRIAKLGPNDIAKLAANSFAASFIPPEQKLAAYAQISAVLAAWKAEQLAAYSAVA